MAILNRFYPSHYMNGLCWQHDPYGAFLFSECQPWHVAVLKCTPHKFYIKRFSDITWCSKFYKRTTDAKWYAASVWLMVYEFTSQYSTMTRISCLDDILPRLDIFNHITGEYCYWDDNVHGKYSNILVTTSNKHVSLDTTTGGVNPIEIKAIHKVIMASLI